MEKESSTPKVTIEDFIVQQKVDAFIERYKPVDKQMQTGEVFNDARLREFFKAVPTPYGDPLVHYISCLESAGFKMRVSIQGEPAIFAEERF